MSNPYQTPQDVPAAALVPGELQPRKVRVRPLARLKEAVDLMGEQYLLFVGICLTFLLINGVSKSILLGPLMCGVHICYADRRNGQKASFVRMFKGFDDFLPSFLATLLIFAFVFLLVIPLVILMVAGIVWMIRMEQVNPDFAATAFNISIAPFMLLCVALSTCIFVPFIFVFALIADRRMNAWEALLTSWRGARKNFWGIVGMLIVYGLLAVPCAMMCYVPLFFLMPLQFGGLFLLYHDVFSNAVAGELT